MHRNDFYKGNNEWNETKHSMNAPYEVLTKCCYFVADPSSKMAASGGTWFNIEPYEKCIPKSSSREPLN